MKPVKAWEALKAWQEEGRKCRPVEYPIADFQSPDFWSSKRFLQDEPFDLEPPKPETVEFEAEANQINYFYKTEKKGVVFETDGEKLHGKRWKVTCVEVVGKDED